MVEGLNGWVFQWVPALVIMFLHTTIPRNVDELAMMSARDSARGVRESGEFPRYDKYSNENKQK